MSDELKQRVKERREAIRAARTLPGISDDVDPDTPPSWYEPEAFRHAQKLFETYAIILRISQLYGLNLVLYHTSGLTPLLATGNSSNIPKLFTRYLSTMLHVNNWFESDPFDKTSKCYRSLKMVRGLHRQVGQKMNKHVQDGDMKWISQYGMAHAQFSFVGFMAIFPKELGFSSFKAKDFHALFHFWRVIGYCLGTDDKYNLCSGSDEETIELCRQIYFDEWLPVIREGTEKTGIAMSEGICVAMAKVSPNVNYNVLMRYASPFMHLDVNNYPLKNIGERFHYFMICTLYGVISKFKFSNWIVTKVGAIRLRRAVRLKQQLRDELAREHPNIEYKNNHCPFDSTCKRKKK
ncbi:hypothetical protein BLOT_009539 [Blomia tropicalis]|nr:hypothetical protein BLOT_009539 [Blomia tropicalis]